jgi:hypothetical protein
MTDANGQATGRGLMPNRAAGAYAIRVTASFRGQMAQATISQTNAEPVEAGANQSKKVLWIVLIGGAVAGGAAAVALGHGGSSSTTPPASPSPAGAVIVAGTPSFQPPR